MDIGLEILFILLLILANGLFAMSEFAILSARKTRLHHAAEKGDRKAKAALELANAPNRFLSTVQIGITLIGILAGAIGGAVVSQWLAGYIELIPSITPYAQGISIAIVVLSITYLTLVLGELVPKRVALHHPEQIARFIARPMQILSAIVSPGVA
ncbi:MAG: CNNM domain-containing protein, partial [Anaerolineae bacterium]|nr:CNNM domain-containing protein [Anaerolineae bacterium]